MLESHYSFIGIHIAYYLLFTHIFESWPTWLLLTFYWSRYCINSAWLVAAFTFERLIVVRYPLKRTKICTVRRAKVIIVSITVMAAIFQLVSFFPTGKKGTGIKRNDSNSTDAAGTHQKTDRAVPFHYEIIRIFSILDTVVTLVIPPVIIVFFNGFIIQGLAEFNKTFKKGTNKHGPSLRKSTLQSDDSHQVNIRVLIFFFRQLLNVLQFQEDAM